MCVEDIIKEKNLKLTSAREELLQILIKAKQPLSYDNVKGDISMDKATFYRNIAIFEEKNLIDSFESNDKKRYFEIKKNPHGHFICNSCNKIECIQKNLQFELSGYSVENIVIKGLCKDCNSKNQI